MDKKHKILQEDNEMDVIEILKIEIKEEKERIQKVKEEIEILRKEIENQKAVIEKRKKEKENKKIEYDENKNIKNENEDEIEDEHDSESEDEHHSKLDEMVFHSHDIKEMDIFEKIKRSICFIKKEKVEGTGFFIEIKIPQRENPMQGLMTVNHVLNEESLKLGESFNISMNNDNEQRINIQKDVKFIFTSELIDVTFIELNREIIEKINPKFLKPSKRDAKINDPVHIFQFHNKKLSYANERIKLLYSFDYFHLVSTDYGSSGSPLLNKDFKVVGIHKARRFQNNNSNVNVATKFSEIKFAIETLFNNNRIEMGKISAQPLKKDKINELKKQELYLKFSKDNHELKKGNEINKFSEDNHELKKENEINKFSEDNHELKKENELNKYEFTIISKSLFYFSSSKYLFYRTNYAWYITISDENKFSVYNFDNLKQLNWFHLIPNSNKLEDHEYSNINPREIKLVNWLKSTEFRYL